MRFGGLDLFVALCSDASLSQLSTLVKTAMRMTEREIKLEARLFAVEFLAAHVLSTVHVAFGTTDEQLDEMYASADEKLSSTSIPNMDPATADMFSAELQEAVQRLMRITRAMTTEKRKNTAGRS
jgi:hypothetical protein